MADTDFDFDSPDLGYEEDLPEFDEGNGVVGEEEGDVLGDITEDGVVDDDPDEILSGMDVAEIVEALEEEYGIKASEDADREILANQLIKKREEELEESTSEENTSEETTGEDVEDDTDDDVEADWVDGDGFEGEDDDIETFSPEEEEDGAEISQSLKSALKTQDISLDDLGIEWALSELSEMGGEITDHKMSVMTLRWKQGLIAAATPVKHGEGTMKKLEEATGVNANTLREAKRVVDHFDHNISMFKDFLREADDGIKPWYKVVESMQDDVPSEDKTEEENEEIKNKLFNTTEKALNKLEEAVVMASKADEEDRREAKGLTAKAERVIRSLRDSGIFDTTGDEAADDTPRSETYMDFIRDFPDPINGNPSHDPAHTSGKKGVASKASDLSTIPLTRTHHNELDENGQDWFESEYNVSIDKLVKNYMHRHYTGQWLDLELPTPEDL